MPSDYQLSKNALNDLCSDFGAVCFDENGFAAATKTFTHAGVPSVRDHIACSLVSALCGRQLRAITSFNSNKAECRHGTRA